MAAKKIIVYLTVAVLVMQTGMAMRRNVFAEDRNSEAILTAASPREAVRGVGLELAGETGYPNVAVLKISAVLDTDYMNDRIDAYSKDFVNVPDLDVPLTDEPGASEDSGGSGQGASSSESSGGDQQSTAGTSTAETGASGTSVAESNASETGASAAEQNTAGTPAAEPDGNTLGTSASKPDGNTPGTPVSEQQQTTPADQQAVTPGAPGTELPVMPEINTEQPVAPEGTIDETQQAPEATDEASKPEQSEENGGEQQTDAIVGGAGGGGAPTEELTVTRLSGRQALNMLGGEQAIRDELDSHGVDFPQIIYTIKLDGGVYENASYPGDVGEIYANHSLIGTYFISVDDSGSPLLTATLDRYVYYLAPSRVECRVNAKIDDPSDNCSAISLTGLNIFDNNWEKVTVYITNKQTGVEHEGFLLYQNRSTLWGGLYSNGSLNVNEDYEIEAQVYWPSGGITVITGAMTSVGMNGEKSPIMNFTANSGGEIKN